LLAQFQILASFALLGAWTPRTRAKLRSLERAILGAEEEDVKYLEERFQRRKREWNGERREAS